MNTENHIVSTPIDLPKLVPDSWDTWWELWRTSSRPLRKTGVSPNNVTGLHNGFDVYRGEVFNPVYQAEFVDISKILPNLYQQIISIPVKLYGVRFIESSGDFLPHIDNHQWSWSLRSMFFCEDPVQQWYYTDLENKNPRYLRLSPETNWWAYYDGAIKHGTKYRKEYPKILLQVFANTLDTERLAKESFSKFAPYLVYYDINKTI